jgi:hypothetical protein
VEDAIDKDILPEDTDLNSETHIIDTINDWAKNRGKIKAGTNVNPVTGTGGRKTKKNETEESEKDASEDTEQPSEDTEDKK